MKLLTKQEKQILVEIFKASNGLFLFTLHRQLNLSPKEIFSAVENLKSLGLIELLEDKVKITKKGIGYSVQNPLKDQKVLKNETKIQDDFVGRKININEFYIPLNFEK